MSNRAIFLDRDGVIDRNRPDNVKHWGEFVFEASALSALACLAPTDFRLIVVTNQSGIGHGQMTRETVEGIHAQMLSAIQNSGGRLDRIYLCPHKPDENCDCRKPKAGMLYWGRDEFDLDLEHSYFIGDWVDDIRAARVVGATPILVRTGRGRKAIQEMQALGMPLPEIADDLSAAVAWILTHESLIIAD